MMLVRAVAMMAALTLSAPAAGYLRPFHPIDGGNLGCIRGIEVPFRSLSYHLSVFMIIDGAAITLFDGMAEAECGGVEQPRRAMVDGRKLCLIIALRSPVPASLFMR